MSSPAIRAHNKTVVFNVYRLLLRQIEDEPTKFQAKRYARESFDKYADMKFAGSTQAEEGIAHAKGVAQILHENVVQGQKNKGDENAPYKLNIHEGTERGDNESIKQFKGTKKSFKSMKA